MSKQSKNILLVGGTPDQHKQLCNILVDGGFVALTATNAQEALDQVCSTEVALLLVDIHLPGGEGLALLSQLQKAEAPPAVIVLSARASVNEAVEVMQQGAADYLAMPLSRERLLAAVEFGLSLSVPSALLGTVAPEEPRSIETPQITTRNALMLTLLDTVRRVADSDATVLITGESGTGKELLAAYVHAHSGRAGQPFVAMNCAALPEQLAESELFGHEKGAFTGAIHRKLGRFELAHQGTLLLDEIGELPLALQAKLLRVLQARVVDRVGGLAPVAIDTRVVATTNRDLKQMVADGTFREDLFYRLRVLPFELPALRKRRDDIPLLVESFIARFTERHHRSIKGITAEALERLMQYPWPGNIRELENTLERAVLISRQEEIQKVDLLLDDGGADRIADVPAGTTVKEMERQLILSTLGHVNANRTQAAEMLGISIRTLRNKLNEYRSENPDVFKAAS
jgi:two-component system response regulator FlrC